MNTVLLVGAIVLAIWLLGSTAIVMCALWGRNKL